MNDNNIINVNVGSVDPDVVFLKAVTKDRSKQSVFIETPTRSVRIIQVNPPSPTKVYTRTLNTLNVPLDLSKKSQFKGEFPFKK